MAFRQSNNTNIYAEDEEDALLWKQPSDESPRDELEEHNNQNVPPDGFWLIPSRFTSFKSHMERIQDSTNTFMNFNKDKNRIDIWGDSDNINEALMQWNNLNDNKLFDTKERKKNEKLERIAAKKQEPGWAKADKAPPLNKKQLEKLKRREEREREENIYKKRPDESKKFPFHAYIVYPYTDIPITLLLGEKEESLDPVRVKNKCHIWHEKPQYTKGIITIVGNTKESVDNASTRVMHTFIKAFKTRSIPDKGWILHALEPPKKPCTIRFTDPPPTFYLPHEKLFPKKFDGKEIPQKYILIEPVLEGNNIPVVGGVEKKNTSSFDSDKLQKKHESNITELKKYLTDALEAVHLFDEVIKMRVRFGRVYLINDQDFDKKLVPIMKLSSRILGRSKFATCLATERDQMNRLFEELSKDNLSWDDLPTREFKIYAMRKDSDDKEEGSVECAFNINFEKKLIKNDSYKSDKKYVGKIGLWDATARKKNILDINMMSLDNYCWKLNIQTAKRLVNSESCPQGKFVNGLRICQNGRLVYSNTNEIKVVSVCEKTKWKFWWNEYYVVEVTKYEFWKVTKYMRRVRIDIPLNAEQSPEVSYGVTLYKRSWDENFAYNFDLGVGEAPEWHPYAFMDGEKDLLTDIGNFLKVLQSNLPMQKI